MRNWLLLLVLFSGCSLLKHPVTVDNEQNSDSSSVEYDYNFYFTEGTKFKLLSNSNQAINKFFKCIQLKPNNPAPYYQLSEIYFGMGDLERALIFSRESVQLDASNSWYLLQLARVYQEKGNIDSTIHIYRKIVKLKPSNYDANFNLALLYFQINKPKKTIHILNSLKHKYGYNDELILALFKIHSYAKDHRNSIKILKEGLRIYPEDIRFYGLLAEYYVSVGDFEHAMFYYNQLLTIDPDNEKGLLSLIEYYRIVKDYKKLNALSYNYISDTTFSYKSKIDIVANLISDKDILNRSNDSIYLLIHVLDSIYSPDFRIQTLYTDYYLKSKKYESAKEKLIFLVDNYKTTMPFWEQLIYVLNSLNDFELMLKYCDSGTRVFGNKPFFYLYKGIALYNLKRINESIPVFKDGLKYAGNSPDLNIQFFRYLGESFHSLKDYAQSDTFFMKAIHLDAKNIFILNNYSFYLAERNVYLDKALEYIKICLDLYPNSSTYLDTYAWVLFKLGKGAMSKKALEISIKNGGIKDKDIIEHYIIVLYSLGDSENALKYFNYLHELGEPSKNVKALFQKN